MKQRISDKKLRKCETVSGHKYELGYTRGGWPHFQVECWINEYNADVVNWKTGEWAEGVRFGVLVERNVRRRQDVARPPDPRDFPKL